MKKALTNLLLVSALALCGLVAVQWVREGRLRQQLQSALDSVQTKSRSVDDLQGQLQRSDEQIARIEKLRNELALQLQTNAAMTLQLRKDLDHVRAEAEQNKGALENYKSALARANANIDKQNQGISKQNDEITSLVKERNELAAKYNKLAKEFDDLAKKWNDQQKELAAKSQKQ